eukprot:9125904-Ditylum_brightwellii.AAC.1
MAWEPFICVLGLVMPCFDPIRLIMPDSAKNSARSLSSRVELKSTISATSAPSFFHFLMRESMPLSHPLCGCGLLVSYNKINFALVSACNACVAPAS